MMILKSFGGFTNSSNLIYVVIIFYLDLTNQCPKENTKLVLKRAFSFKFQKAKYIIFPRWYFIL